MKNTAILTLALISALVTPAIQKAYASIQTVDGIVSDSMCVKKHMMPGKSSAQCSQECVKAGSTYVLVAGDKVYSLNGKAATIAPFAGKHVQVQGNVNQKTIDVSSIQEAKTAPHAGMQM
jgi:hypothetical protein